jgi:hypothetical protein
MGKGGRREGVPGMMTSGCAPAVRPWASFSAGRWRLRIVQVPSQPLARVQGRDGCRRGPPRRFARRGRSPWCRSLPGTGSQLPSTVIVVTARRQGARDRGKAGPGPFRCGRSEPLLKSEAARCACNDPVLKTGVAAPSFITQHKTKTSSSPQGGSTRHRRSLEHFGLKPSNRVLPRQEPVPVTDKAVDSVVGPWGIGRADGAVDVVDFGGVR